MHNFFWSRYVAHTKFDIEVQIFVIFRHFLESVIGLTTYNIGKRCYYSQTKPACGSMFLQLLKNGIYSNICDEVRKVLFDRADSDGSRTYPFTW